MHISPYLWYWIPVANGWMRRHWTGESGACRLPTCTSPQGELLLLLSGACPVLSSTLAKLLQYWDQFLSLLPNLLPPVQAALQASPEAFTTFLLDLSTDPGVINLVQKYGRGILDNYLPLARSWIWVAHRRHLQPVGLHIYLL